MARNNNGAPSEDLDNYIDDLADTGDSGDTNDTTVETNDQSADRTTDHSATTQDHTQQTRQEPAGTTDQTTGKQPAPKTQQPGQDKTQTPQQQQLKPVGNGVFADGEGNLVTSDGKLIAEKGFAARMHQQNQRFRTQNETLTAEVNDLRTRVTELRALDSSMRTAGINADEMAQALDFASRYKRGDVLGIAKEIVALAMASGHNATDILGKDVGDSIDMRAVTTLMDQRLGPIVKTRQEDERKAAAEKTARENYTRFVSDNEYADVHGEAIVRLARAENIPMQTAYNRLYRFAIDNQLDFTQDLGPQIQARQQAPQQQPAQQPPTPKPMPNGATTRTNGALPTAVEPMNSADDDWGTILRQAMTTM